MAVFSSFWLKILVLSKFTSFPSKWIELFAAICSEEKRFRSCFVLILRLFFIAFILVFEACKEDAFISMFPAWIREPSACILSIILKLRFSFALNIELSEDNNVEFIIKSSSKEIILAFVFFISFVLFIIILFLEIICAFELSREEVFIEISALVFIVLSNFILSFTPATIESLLINFFAVISNFSFEAIVCLLIMFSFAFNIIFVARRLLDSIEEDFECIDKFFDLLLFKIISPSAFNIIFVARRLFDSIEEDFECIDKFFDLLLFKIILPSAFKVKDSWACISMGKFIPTPSWVPINKILLA